MLYNNQHVIKGYIREIRETKIVGDHDTPIQEFILEVVGKFPQYLEFKCARDKREFLKNLKEGDYVEVKFYLSGAKSNKYPDRIFLNAFVQTISVVATDENTPRPKSEPVSAGSSHGKSKTYPVRERNKHLFEDDLPMDDDDEIPF